MAGRWCVLVALFVGPLVVYAGEFEGCFGPPITQDESTESIQLRTNTNQDCAAHCADRGYIMAATRVDLCICTMVFPEKELASSVYSNASAPISNIPVKHGL
ncbi:hypothetical protein CAPTEDRAFT_198519 [Capitella teleta]|uniref:Uncharacterized protein n=1 Tax=Capitella teleta TaxID=283909 RepID=R7TYB9_CAPTE|nr:hypothetical protein CAPTEDRAFT_198519 [Capitella teleta]|eukprot:ELT98893.1 hypothetical protein CAPTEDRAFT_198519 [Capitella teleta]